MLTIIIEGDEYYDEETEQFYTVNDVVVTLEHSLLSLSKWESKHQKPFLSSGQKTPEEIFSYLSEMLVSPQDPGVLHTFSQKEFDAVQEYIDSPQSATTFGQMPERRGSGETITSELIYYWMVTFNIPFECQQWHLNRLFALIRVCNVKNSPPAKMSKHAIAARNRQLNEQRKAQLNTTG